MLRDRGVNACLSYCLNSVLNVCFQPGEGPSSGSLRDYEPSDSLRLKHYYLDILPRVPSHHEHSISLNVQPKWPATAICRYIPQIDYDYNFNCNYNYNYTATPPRPLPFYFMILQFFSHQNFWTFCPQRIRDQIKIKFWIDWAESEHTAAELRVYL